MGIWKPIPGFEGYEVSDEGRIRSFYAREKGKGWYIANEPQRILKPSLAGRKRKRYLGVNLGKGNYIKIHKLVLLTFAGQCPRGLVACHNDDNPENNHLDNLRYDTPQSNFRDAILNGSRSIKASDVLKIKKEYIEDDYTLSELAKRYDTTISVIRSLVTGRTYFSIDDSIASKLQEKNRRAKQIRIDFANDKKTASQLAKEHGLTVSAISRIINGSRQKEADGPIQGIDYPQKPQVGSVKREIYLKTLGIRG